MTSSDIYTWYGSWLYCWNGPTKVKRQDRSRYTSKKNGSLTVSHAYRCVPLWRVVIFASSRARGECKAAAAVLRLYESRPLNGQHSFGYPACPE